MKILYVIDEHPSLTETFVMREVDAIVELGHQVTVQPLRSGHPDGISIGDRDGVTVLEPPRPRDWVPALARRPRGALRAARTGCREGRLRGLVRMLFAHVVATKAGRQLSTESSMRIHAHFAGRCADVAWLLHHYRGWEFSVTGHASDLFKPDSLRSLRRRLGSAHQLVVVSDAARRRVLALVPDAACRTHVIRCGLPLGDFHMRTSSPRDGDRPVRIVTVARLTEKKGLSTALEAAAFLQAQEFDYQWVIAGDGPLREALLRQIDQDALGGNVHLIGAVSNEDALRITARADLFVLPCVSANDGDVDGIPVALMESMALGTPVVTTAIGGIPELVSDGINGYLAKPADPGDLAQTIRRALSDNTSSVLAAARTTIESEYDIARNAASIARLFDRSGS